MRDCCPKMGYLNAVSVEDGVGVGIQKFYVFADDRDGIQSS